MTDALNSAAQMRWQWFAPAITLHYTLFLADLQSTCQLYPEYPYRGGCVPVGAAGLTALGLILPLCIGRYLDVRQRRTFALQHARSRNHAGLS